MKRNAFTLPEVMITIGIIGIVAALVIPQLIQKMNEKDLVAGYLKSHNVLSNAYKEAEAVEGYKLFSLAPDKFKAVFEEHLKIAGKTTCEHDICLADGSAFDYECDEEKCNYITVDTNGGKKPNQIGKDIYKFRVTEQGLISEGEKEICSGYDCGNYVLANHKIFDGLLPGCETYGDDGRCIACADGNRLNNGLCNPVNMEGCKSYSGEICSSCNDGYSNNEGNCEKLNLQNCLAYTGDKCSSCSAGNHAYGGICHTDIANCADSEYGNTCSSCLNGYYPSSGRNSCIAMNDLGSFYSQDDEKVVMFYDAAQNYCSDIGLDLPDTNQAVAMCNSSNVNTKNHVIWTKTPDGVNVYMLDGDTCELLSVPKTTTDYNPSGLGVICVKSK